MQFTIEARELARPRSAFDGQTIVEASDASDAITRYVKEQDAELVSITRPPSGGESIATVRKEDTILLVRVYAA